MFLQCQVPLRVILVTSIFSSLQVLCSAALRLAILSPRSAERDTCEGAPTLKLVRLRYAGKLRIRKITSSIGSPSVFIALYWVSVVMGLLLSSDEGPNVL